MLADSAVLSNSFSTMPNITTTVLTPPRAAPFNESTFIEVLKNPEVLFTSLFLVVLNFLSVVGNALVCRTIYVTRRLHFPGYYFVASLAVADFLVGVFVIPLSILYFITSKMKGKWIFSIPLCDAWILANFWFAIASILGLCGVTWDRFVAVTSPLRYTMRMSDRHVTRLIVAIWLTSLMTAVFNCYGLKTSPTRVLCEVQGLPRVYTIFDFILLFLVPLVSVVFVNCKIWIAASRQIRRIQAQAPRAIETNQSKESVPPVFLRQGQGTPNNLGKEIKIFRTFLIVIGSFFISWTPFFFIIVIDSFSRVSSIVAYMCGLLTYINSAFNPLIYGVFNREFRQALLNSFTCSIRRR